MSTSPRGAQEELTNELYILRTQNEALSNDLSTLRTHFAAVSEELERRKQAKFGATANGSDAQASSSMAPGPGVAKGGAVKRWPMTNSSPSAVPSSQSTTHIASPKKLSMSMDHMANISNVLSQSMPMMRPPGMGPRPPGAAPSGAVPGSTMGSPPTGFLNLASQPGPSPSYTNPAVAYGGVSTNPMAGPPPMPVVQPLSSSAPIASPPPGSSSISSPTPSGRTGTHVPTSSNFSGSGMVSSTSSGSLHSEATTPIFGSLVDVLYEEGSTLLRAASLDSLIKLLASSDSTYIDTFLMTYRAYIKSDELFNRMVEMWNRASQHSNMNELKIFRIKFMNVVIKWIEKHSGDFDDSSLSKVTVFLDAKLAEGTVSSTTHGKIAALIRHKLERTTKKVLHTADTPLPPPIMPPSDLDSLDVTLIDPLEIARQITLMDESVYKSIMPSECMNQAWNKPAIATEVSPNILKLIGRFNAISNWSARFVVSEANIRKRKTIMSRIIRIALRLRELHNYNSLLALIAALESAPVTRMKKTWEMLDKSDQKAFTELRALMSAEGSYKAFRAAVKTDDPPIIPYIGVYLADLTFIEDGNPSKIQDEQHGELINFAKMKMLDSVIQDISMYQQAPYKLEQVVKMQNWLASEEEKKLTDKELFDLSLKSEPRVPQK